MGKEVGKEMSPGVQPIKPKTTTGRARTPSTGHMSLVKRRALDHRLSSWKRKGVSERIELSLGIVVVDKTWLSEDKAASDIQIITGPVESPPRHENSDDCSCHSQIATILIMCLSFYKLDSSCSVLEGTWPSGKKGSWETQIIHEMAKGHLC